VRHGVWQPEVDRRPTVAIRIMYRPAPSSSGRDALIADHSCAVKARMQELCSALHS
jgi:hypothetical protein